MKNYIFTLSLFVYAVSLPAQHFEVGVMVGGSNYLGDLTPSRLWTSLGETNLYTGGMVRYTLLDWFTFRAGLNFGRIAANDANAFNDDPFRSRRNLSFRSNVTELELTTEINLFRYRPLHLRTRFSPYVFIGAGIFRFNPQAYYQGRWYDLQPLGTEGQGMPGYKGKYLRTQLSVPLGFGFKYALSENLNIGFQYGMRKTFTDYLDDTSRFYPDLNQLAQENGEMARELSWRTDEIDPNAKPPAPGAGRGDPKDMDWYIFTGVFVSYNFIESSVYRPAKNKSGKIKCPKVRKKKSKLGGLLLFPHR